MKPIKLVFCTDGIYPLATGGMQKHSRLLIEQLSGNPELFVTVLHPHVGTVFNNERIHEISVEPINTEKNYLRECYRYSQRIARELCKLQFDVIYSQGLSVWADIDQFKDRLIINPHGLEPYQAIGLKNRLLAIPFKLTFDYLFRKATCVISLGGKLTGILEKRVHDAKKIAVIPNGVNLPPVISTRSFGKDKVRVLFLARFAANKGINILFRAIEELHMQGHLEYFDFILGGKGPLYNHYFSKNKYNNVQFLGFVADEQINHLYQTADLFVLPTLFEGMPTVVLEAMTHGLPVIVTDVGATSELVGKENGFLIQKGSVTALVSSLLRFRKLGSTEKIKMSSTSLEKVKQRFTWHTVADNHCMLFQKITASATSNR